MKNANDIFDRKQVRLHRNRAANTLKNHGILFETIASRLCERLHDFQGSFNTALDLGCHTGYIAKNPPPPNKIKFLIQSDLSERMLRKTTSPAIVADEEHLPFKPASFDLIISNLSLHWVNQLPATLQNIRQMLKPKGIFLASIFGSHTLTELRQVTTTIDSNHNKIVPRISPFIDTKDMGRLIQQAGFSHPVSDMERLTLGYTNAAQLMKELRFMGETNSLYKQGSPTPNPHLEKINQQYQQKFSHKNIYDRTCTRGRKMTL